MNIMRSWAEEDDDRGGIRSPNGNDSVKVRRRRSEGAYLHFEALFGRIGPRREARPALEKG